MATVSTGFEQGTSGAALSAGNSGGGADDPFDTVTNASSVLTFDTTHVHSGTRALKGVTVASNSSFGEFNTAFGAQTEFYGRVYVYITANPTTSQWVIWRGFNAGTGVARVGITAAGKVRLDYGASFATTAYTSTGTVTLNAWNRIEWHVKCASTAAGQFDVRINNTNPDSATADEASSNGSALNLGQSQATQQQIGAFGSAASGDTFWVDDYALSTTGWVGPVVAGPSPSSTFIVGASVVGGANLLEATTFPGSGTALRPVTAGLTASGSIFSSVAYGLDYGNNTGRYGGSDASLISLIRSTYAGSNPYGMGPHCKFFDGGATPGIGFTTSHVDATDWGSAAGEKSPVLCYKGSAIAADLRTAYAWAMTNFPNQPVYIVHDQEVEGGTVTPAQYQAKFVIEDSVRQENPAWAQWIKLAACLRGYKEFDSPGTYTWPDYLQTVSSAGYSIDIVDVLGWDVYDMDFYTSAWTPATYVAPMFTASAALGIPCAVMEWGTTVSQTTTTDTETTRATRTQAVVNYLNARAYHPVNRPTGVLWANYWENYWGYPNDATRCTTGMVKQITVDGVTPPSYTVLQTAMATAAPPATGAFDVYSANITADGAISGPASGSANRSATATLTATATSAALATLAGTTALTAAGTVGKSRGATLTATVAVTATNLAPAGRTGMFFSVP